MSEHLRSWSPRWGQCICCATNWFHQLSCSQKLSLPSPLCAGHLQLHCFCSGIPPSWRVCDILWFSGLDMAASCCIHTREKQICNRTAAKQLVCMECPLSGPWQIPGNITKINNCLFWHIVMFRLIQASTVWGVIHFLSNGPHSRKKSTCWKNQHEITAAPLFLTILQLFVKVTRVWFDASWASRGFVWIP